MKTQITRIRSVIFTLNQIETRGRENFDKMLGCMAALDKTAADLEAMAAEQAKAGDLVPIKAVFAEGKEGEKPCTD